MIMTTDTHDFVIELKDVTKPLERFTLGPLNLTLEPGYIYALVGPNGSGKSTLFRMLMNLVKPASGEVQLIGHSYSPDAEPVIKRRIGYVPELTEWEEIAGTIGELTAFIRYWYPGWNEGLYRELLAKFQLDEGLKLKKLSKGMQRKLALVYALAQEPELLLLDEPTAGLDPLAWRDCMKEISRFMADGRRTVVMATHILEEVRRMADYVMFLYEGRLLGTFEKDTLLEEWKSLWVDRAPEGAERIPGVVHVERGPVADRLITRQAAQTESALKERGVTIRTMGALELDEIFAYMIGK
ncbi:ABC transporter ATP-binding protein [Paenibacillus chartarius]|uniref:ABC transporter ATP-binding protein n=1 Tax=Paenibacillus chartarius TaxID=747481 RepID=A0ABV6DG87_9BACL